MSLLTQDIFQNFRDDGSQVVPGKWPFARQSGTQ